MGLSKEFNQEVKQEIIWTENDINRLYEQLDEIYNYNLNGEKDYGFITTYEQEFILLYFDLQNNLL